MAVKYTNYLILAVFINDFCVFLRCSATYNTRLSKIQLRRREVASIVRNWCRDLFNLLCGRCRNLPWHVHTCRLLWGRTLISADLRCVQAHLSRAPEQSINMIYLPIVLHGPWVLLWREDIAVESRAKVPTAEVLAGST